MSSKPRFVGESKRVMLADVCNVLDSKRIPITRNKRLAGPYPYYGANGIQDYVADYIFDDELVLLAEDGGHFEGGKQIAYRVSGKCWVNNHAHVLKAKKNIDTDYLYFALRCYDVTSLTNGATRKKLTQAAMKRMLLPLRSINDQLYIVNNLKSVETQLESARKQLSKLDGLVKSRFVEMFGDPSLPDGRWRVARLDSFTHVITGNTPSRKKPEYYGEGIEWVKTDNIANSFVSTAAEQLTAAGQEKARVAPAGSILMTCIAGSVKSIGKVGLLNREVAFNQQINAIVPEEDVNSKFLLVLLTLSKNYLCSSVNMQLKGILNKSSLSAKEFSLPPLELQQEFAAFASQVDKSRFIAQQQIEKLQMLYDSLAQDYFGD